MHVFFPATPRSKRLQLAYADAHGEHRLDIDTRHARTELERQVDPPATLRSRVEPSFPRDARRQGVDRGYVVANLILDRSGRVGKVEVIESMPFGVFTQEARRAMQQWIYNEDYREARVVEARLDFHR